MASILIFKNKYFQTHGLQNMWDLLSDVWNLRRMQLLLSTDRMANFLLFTDGKIPPPRNDVRAVPFHHSVYLQTTLSVLSTESYRSEAPLQYYIISQ